MKKLFKKWDSSLKAQYVFLGIAILFLIEGLITIQNTGLIMIVVGGWLIFTEIKKIRKIKKANRGETKKNDVLIDILNAKK